MNRYPFIVRRSKKGVCMAVVIVEHSYPAALKRILARYPNKFITITHCRLMDYITARVEAAALSKKKGKPVYIMYDSRDEAHSKTSGECELSFSPDSPKHYKAYALYKNGSEVALEPEQTEELKKQTVEPKKRNYKIKQTNKMARKKGVKTFTIDQLCELIEKGNAQLFSKSGRVITLAYLKGLKKKDRTFTMEKVVTYKEVE